MRIYYLTDGRHSFGGQVVNLEHVLALRRLGYDARYLVVPPPGEAPKVHLPPGVEVPWQTDVSDLTASDCAVIGEMNGAAANLLAKSPARKLIHNQNLFYTFRAFRDLQVIQDWGCEGILTASTFTADGLRRIGWPGPIWTVRPFLDPVFAATPASRNQLAIASMTRKRPSDWLFLRGLVKSWRPDLEVHFHSIANVPRVEAAKVMASCPFYLSLSHEEGLGLPPLEAMAAGAVVIGFHGGGGREYATAENGDWFEDGEFFEVAERLVQRFDEYLAGERFEARVAAGRETAAGFNRARFDADLAAAWGEIAGPPPR